MTPPMKKLAILLLLAVPLALCAQNKKPPTTLRGVLLEQLHTTHDQEDWFVPANIAVGHGSGASCHALLM